MANGDCYGPNGPCGQGDCTCTLGDLVAGTPQEGWVIYADGQGGYVWGPPPGGPGGTFGCDDLINCTVVDLVGEPDNDCTVLLWENGQWRLRTLQFALDNCTTGTGGAGCELTGVEVTGPVGGQYTVTVTDSCNNVESGTFTIEGGAVGCDDCCFDSVDRELFTFCPDNTAGATTSEAMWCDDRRIVRFVGKASGPLPVGATFSLQSNGQTVANMQFEPGDACAAANTPATVIGGFDAVNVPGAPNVCTGDCLTVTILTINGQQTNSDELGARVTLMLCTEKVCG